MEIQYVSMKKRDYLAAMKRKFSSPLYLWDARLTGFVVGSFFAVAHYQPYEWNRKITSECNRAYGYVKEVHGELQIHYFRGYGLLAPGWLLVMTLLCRLIFWIAEIQRNMDIGVTAWVVSFACALLACVISAIQVGYTDAGVLGAREVEKFLENPEEYYV
jgi:hypothetical protein